MLSLVILNCLATAYLLEVWFNSNAPVEYAELLGLTRLLYIRDYLNILNPVGSTGEGGYSGYPGSYIDFLKEYYSTSFFYRLITCPTCLSFWFALVSTVIFEFITFDYLCLIWLLPMAFLNLFLYRVLNKLV